MCNVQLRGGWIAFITFEKVTKLRSTESKKERELGGKVEQNGSAWVDITVLRNLDER